MRVSLINLGDGGRAIYDINNKFVSVPVGEIVSADVSESTLKNLNKFQKTDTLLVAPEGTISPPIKLRAALELMKVMDEDHYETLIRRYFEIVNPRSIIDVRPTRGQMRAGLRNVVEQHLQNVTERPEPVSTHDDEQKPASIAAAKANNQVRRHKRR